MGDAALGRLTSRYVVLGSVALAALFAYERTGPVGLLAVALPLAVLGIRMRRRLAHALASASEIERTNVELRLAKADLEALNEFAAELPAHAYDSRQLAAYAQGSLESITGAAVHITVGDKTVEGATPLDSSGRTVGSLLVAGGDFERWKRLRPAIESQLACALESTMLVEQGRRTHLETIAALSRSLGSKDDYTGGHTERVSDIALGLAGRLGYAGPDLDAIEIGALMHDIGKIGIPESILHKAGPLTNDEWIVMKRHPVISELILSETALSPIVLEIARSSHERMDGQGYPDGLVGEQIPLPARIVLVADAFDALTSDRPYRRARRPRAAIEEIAANSGDQFCPRVVAALRQLYGEEPAVLGEVVLSVLAS